MNEFDRRWKIAAAAARAARQNSPETLPFGFANRVVASWKSAPPLPLSALWLRLGWRALGGVTAALLVLAAMSAAFSTADDPLTPPMGDTVTEVFWLP
jgi:hypothetical protein